MKCPKCNKQISVNPGDHFCPKCGAKVTSATPQPSAAKTTSPSKSLPLCLALVAVALVGMLLSWFSFDAVLVAETGGYLGARYSMLDLRGFIDSFESLLQADMMGMGSYSDADLEILSQYQTFVTVANVFFFAWAASGVAVVVGAVSMLHDAGNDTLLDMGFTALAIVSAAWCIAVFVANGNMVELIAAAGDSYSDVFAPGLGAYISLAAGGAGAYVIECC